MFGVKSLFNEPQKKASQGWKVGEEGMEGIAIHGEDIHAAPTPHGSHPWAVADKRHLPKTLPRTKMSESDLPFFAFFNTSTSPSTMT